MPRLSVSKDGTITAIYSDELVDLTVGGRGELIEITRASNVEPDANGLWVVRMTDGVTLPQRFVLRADALAAEVDYLERKLFKA